MTSQRSWILGAMRMSLFLSWIWLHKLRWEIYSAFSNMLTDASIKLSPFLLVKTLASSQLGCSQAELPQVSTIGPNIEANFSLEGLEVWMRITFDSRRLNFTFSILWALKWLMINDSISCRKVIHSLLSFQTPFSFISIRNISAVGWVGAVKLTSSTDTWISFEISNGFYTIFLPLANLAKGLLICEDI